MNAGYRAGRTNMRTAVCHYTVGRDSTGIGKQGYFQFLIARNGTIQQFAEVDAVNWHAGSPWNGRGPALEIEYLPGHDDEVFTVVQRDATRAVCEWLRDEWGIPFAYYDGPRISDHHGFITHRSLIQSGDPHSDFWPAEDAAIIFGDDDDMNDLQNSMLKDIWDRTKDMRDGIPAFGVPPWHDITAAIARIEAAVNAGGTGGAGLSGAEVAAIVRAELNKTRLGT
jgi:hypothetical protein